MEPVSMDNLLAKLQAARDAMRTTAPSLAPPAAKTVDFGALLKGSLDQVNAAQTTAESLSARFQVNDPNVTLEDTMVSIAKANVSFQAAVQVRNRLVTAYHDIMNMQV
jgi:flagellar hook-basal body complex protein FliE